MKLNCVMLIDDNSDDNYFHERVLKKTGIVKSIIVKKSAQEALDYLKLHRDPDYLHPDLIFLDINMPRMNGWEFLEEYSKLDAAQKGRMVIIMLTSSDNPVDIHIAKSVSSVLDFRTKPLTSEMLNEIFQRYFKMNG